MWDEATVLPRSTNCRLSVTDLEKKKDFPSRRTPSKQIAESGRRRCAASCRRCGACGASVAPYAPRYSFSALARVFSLPYYSQSSIEPSQHYNSNTLCSYAMQSCTLEIFIVQHCKKQLHSSMQQYRIAMQYYIAGLCLAQTIFEISTMILLQSDIKAC